MLLRGLALLGCSYTLPAGAAGSSLLRIAYGDNFAPFNWVDENGATRGILVDLLTEALQERLAVPVSHQGFPWSRAQRMVQQGLADALCTVPTAERLAYAAASREAVASSTFTLFTRRDHPRLAELKQARTLDDLREFALIHYEGSSWAREHLTASPVIWTISQAHALRMVAAGRGDGFIDASEPLRINIRTLNLTRQLVELPQVFDTQAFHLLIRMDNPAREILPRFDAVLRRMRAEKANARIYAKYGVLAPVRGN